VIILSDYLDIILNGQLRYEKQSHISKRIFQNIVKTAFFVLKMSQNDPKKAKIL